MAEMVSDLVALLLACAGVAFGAYQRGKYDGTVEMLARIDNYDDDEDDDEDDEDDWPRPLPGDTFISDRVFPKDRNGVGTFKR